PEAGEHRLVAQEADVRRVPLTGRLDVGRCLQTVGSLGQEGRDPRGGVVVLEEVRAVQALVEGVDDGHRRRVSLGKWTGTRAVAGSPHLVSPQQFTVSLPAEEAAAKRPDRARGTSGPLGPEPEAWPVLA